MQSGAGDFPDGEQSGQRSAPLQIGAHSAADVVGGGNDGDWRDRHIDPEGLAGRVDVREVVHQERLPQMRHVQVGAVVASPLQLAVDAARDHVARGELLARVVALHERIAGAVAQNPAFSAQRLADQEALRLRVVQAGGMKLDELQICDGCPRAVGHGQPVAGGDVRVRRVEVDLAGAAGCQHHRLADEAVHR